MMRVVATAPVHDVSKRVDEYVPIEVEMSRGGQSIDELFYWRATGPTYVLEIKILVASGIVDGLTLVRAPREWTRIVDSVHVDRKLERRVGIPIVDLAPWKARIGNREIGIDPSLRRIDEAAPFVFEIGSDGIAIRLASTEPLSIVSNPDVDFLVATDGLLCGVIVTGLTKVELQLLRERFAS